MMVQTHFGYTYWNQPDPHELPELRRLLLEPGSAMGIAL